MIHLQELMSLEKESIPEASKGLSKEELSQLVELLSEKDDKIRYQALLLLQSRSEDKDDVYPYWDVFCTKLKSDNSYQRSIGLMLLADNVKWDTNNKIDAALDDYLAILTDEKPITIRQCIQSLSKLVSYKPHLAQKLADELMALDLLQVKETMRKLILMDILTVLLQIRKITTMPSIDTYIANALNGEILDKKAKKMVEKELG